MPWLNALAEAGAALENMEAAEIGRLLRAGSDLVLLLDEDGIVRDVTVRSERLRTALPHAVTWLGSPWADAVTVESRGKVERLLAASQRGDEPQRRQLNYPADGLADVAVQHTAIKLRQRRTVAVFGQDLAPYSALHERLMAAQDAIEREYATLRGAEARAEALFDGATDALLTVGAANLLIAEANPAARRLFGPEAVAGRALGHLFAPAARPSLDRFVAALQRSGRAEASGLAPAHGGNTLALAGALLQGADGLLILLRINGGDGLTVDPAIAASTARLLDVVEQSPDGFVFTDRDGRVIAANAAFIDMVELPTLDSARDLPLDDWLGDDGALDVLLATLRTRGMVRLFPAGLRGTRGGRRTVEISAVMLGGADRAGGTDGAYFGFTVRDLARRLEPAPNGADAPTADLGSPERLLDLIGRVPLRDLVRDATDVIERLCVAEALRLAGDNRAAAAELLGLSRQSFYVKLRRFGLGAPTETEA